MRTKKKITKKKLKEPDEFISFTQQAFLFITQHFKKVVTAGIIVLALILFIVLYQMWEKQKEVEAYRDFGLAMEMYRKAGSMDRERLPSEYKNVLARFDEVITKFPGTSSGRFSLLYKGNIDLQMGEFEEAIKAYQAFLEKAGEEKLYRLFALEGLGYAYQGKKDYENALRTYQKIAEMGEGIQTADAYLNRGLCYERLGKNKEALENYKAFLKVSQKSVMTNLILRKISSLER